MYTFTSVNNGYMIIGKPDEKGEPEYMVEFSKAGSTGSYITKDEELVKKLRGHPDFGKRFMEIGLNARENPNIVQGLRSSATSTESGKEPLDPEKLIKFGMLQATLLKKDGSYRKDASEEDKSKYEQLKKELE